MRIAKPMLMVTTPLGVMLGLREAWRVGWWLAALMLAMLSVLTAFSTLTLRRIRTDARRDAERFADGRHDEHIAVAGAEQALGERPSDRRP